MPLLFELCNFRNKAGTDVLGNFFAVDDGSSHN